MSHVRMNARPSIAEEQRNAGAPSEQDAESTDDLGQHGEGALAEEGWASAKREPAADEEKS